MLILVVARGLKRRYRYTGHYYVKNTTLGGEGASDNLRDIPGQTGMGGRCTPDTVS